MLEQTNLITAEDINAILADLDHRSALKALTEEAASSSPFVEAAAVLAYYDPQTIKPLGNEHEISGTPEDLKNILIGQSEIVADSTAFETGYEGLKRYKVLFTLKEDVRKAALKRLAAENRVPDAIKVNRGVHHSDIPLQYLLTRCLEGQKIALPSLTFDELTALHRIVYWLEDVPDIHLPGKQEIIRQMELVEMLGPFKHLTGVYENNVFVEKFKGRKAELTVLRSYAGVADPKNIYETIKRKFDSFLSDEKKPLFIFGPGGVGKSALLSKFLLEHAEARISNRFPFVYLDFDRPNLSVLDTETLILEAARQLAIQYIDIGHMSYEFSNFYYKWNNSYATLTGTAGTSQINVESVKHSSDKQRRRSAMRKDFTRLAQKLYGGDRKPFLIVLDTFEEVQFKGVEFVREVLGFLEQLREDIPKLRAVIAGRAPLDKNTTIELELGDLDPEAAQAFLQANGVSAADAKQISRRVSGNPLSLKLAAELVKKHGIKELLGVDLGSSYFSFLRRPEIEVQGVLYNRILKHLHSPDVKKIAHPGLVLRKITPELILEVLAGPCQLKIETVQAAKALFDELGREVSLVTKQGPDTLKHRPDVRKVMLKLIMQSDKREQAMQIHQLAITFYSKRDSLIDRAEEFYHQLAIGVSPRELENRWIDGIEDHLAGNIDELPERAQAFLLGKAGMEATNFELWEMADIEDRVRHMTKQAANLLNSGLAERALNLLDDAAIGERTDAAITTIKVRALRQLNKYAEAAQLSSQALKSFYADEIPLAVRAELQKYAVEQIPQEDPEWQYRGSTHEDPSASQTPEDDKRSDYLKMSGERNNMQDHKRSEDDDQTGSGLDFTTFNA